MEIYKKEPEKFTVIKGKGQPVEGNVFSLEMARNNPEHCQHRTMIVDEKLNTLTCKQCGSLLNPIWALARFHKEESSWKWTLKAYKEMLAERDARTRTKCQHCGKMTRIKGL